MTNDKDAEHVFLTESGELVVLSAQDFEDHIYKSGEWALPIGRIVLKYVLMKDAIGGLKYLGEL